MTPNWNRADAVGWSETVSRAVRAEVRYLNPEWKGRREVPRIGDGASRRSATHKRTVGIDEVRGEALGLDTAGFVLVEHTTEVRDFHDRERVVGAYYEEIARAVRRVTGADRVFVDGHTIRTEDTRGFNAAYARYVHCDYSLSGGGADRRALVERKYGQSLGSDTRWEFAWYNTWQPIERAVYRNPLAVIDARTLDLDDMVDYWYTGPRSKPLPGRPGVPANASLGSMPVFDPRQRFCYFRQMRTDEMMVFKQLDTRPGGARGCPHTSFEIDAPPDAPGRRSIEVRVVCAFAG